MKDLKSFFKYLIFIEKYKIKLNKQQTCFYYKKTKNNWYFTFYIKNQIFFKAYDLDSKIYFIFES